MDVEDGRHFKNTLDDAIYPQDLEKRLAEAISTSEAKLREKVLGRPQQRGTVYTGSAGFACVLLQMVECGLRDLSVCEHALRCLLEAEGLCDSRRVSLLEGQPGCIALQAWAYKLLGDHPSARRCVSRLGDLASRALSLPNDECEVLYGRCGYLCAILLVRQRLQEPDLLSSSAAELVSQIINEGKRGSKDGWPLYYKWHEKCYLGGAHGISGILMTLLQLPAELALAGSDSVSLIRATAEKLLDCRFGSGNLPSSFGNSKDRLVQFCHGATGLVPLLICLAKTLSDVRFLELANEAATVVWTRGLLSTKGLGLCHGISGNGYALLALYRATNDQLWLRRASHFAAFAIEHEQDLNHFADRPYSLFEGLSGALCFWTDVLQTSSTSLEESGSKRMNTLRKCPVTFPCYEFLV